MAGKPLGPFLVFASLAVLAFAGSRAKTYELNEHIECSFEMAREQAPAADVLFVGNSRAGSAIDPLYIEKRLEDATGRKLTVERLTLALPDVPPMRVLARDYVRERGNPQVVVLQLLVNRDASMQNLVGKPIHPLRTIAFGRVDDLVAVQRETDFGAGGSVLARFEKGYLSLPAVLMAKLTTNIYAALRWPTRVAYHTVVDCSGERGDRQSQYWRYGDLSDTDDYRAETGMLEDEATRRAYLANYLAYDPADPARHFETDQMHRLIDTFRQGGSRVFLTIYPQLSVTVPAAERARIEAEFAEAGFIDGTAFAERAGTAHDPARYRDEHHVNRAGALVLSRGYAERLVGELK